MALPTEREDGSNSLAIRNVFATSEWISVSQQQQHWPRPELESGHGILVVRLSRGVGFSVPDQFKEALSKEPNPPPAQGWLSFRKPTGYVIAEYDKSQACAYATRGTVENPEWMERRPHEEIKFDVSRIAELTLRFYLKKPGAAKGEGDIPLGMASITPMLEEKKGTERLPIQDGTGEVFIEMEYIKNTTSETDDVLDTKRVARMRTGRNSKNPSVVTIHKKDTQVPYAVKTMAKSAIVPTVDDTTYTFLPQANKPFVAPLKFICQTPTEVHLYAPRIQGNSLLYALQKQPCFDVDRSRFYAAEIVCAFESIQPSNPLYHGPKWENILLDWLGHVVLSDFGLYSLDTVNSMQSSVEYPAPEVLSPREDSAAGTLAARWWWNLGIFLYEMLTGVPAFYAEDTAEVHRKILSDEPIALPDSLPPAARDILTGLLDRDPEQRLGAKQGAAEVKAHPFFDPIDWDKLVQRRYQPAYRPVKVRKTDDEGMDLMRSDPQLARDVFAGFSYNRSGSVEPRPATEEEAISLAVVKYRQTEEAKRDGQEEELTDEDEGWKLVDGKQEWDLVWDDEAKRFYFYNGLTDEKQDIEDEKTYRPILPSKKRGALGAVLKNGYTHLIPKLLRRYGEIDLHGSLRNIQGNPSPLEYAAGQRYVKVVELFIKEGARDHTGTSLFKAVKNGDQELVRLLATATGRVERTRALGRAVFQQDASVANVLLACDARCDFEEADRPPPEEPGWCGTMRDPVWMWDFIPPLVRAVQRGDVDLVRLLLDHGADANVRYHNLYGVAYLEGKRHGDIDVFCGRPVQLAMQLGRRDMVEVLLDYGADIHLPQPVWKHECPMIPRATYLRVMVALREMEAARRSTSGLDGNPQGA